MIDAPGTILIANTRLIGDVVLTTPLVEILMDAFPGVAIDVLVNRGTGEFLEKDPRIRRVIYSEKWRNSASGFGSSYLLGLVRKYDLAITMNSGDRGAMAVLVASRRYRVGFCQTDKPYSRFLRSRLFSHPIDGAADMHMVGLCGQIADALGIPYSLLRVRLFWDKGDEERVAATLGGEPVPPYFVIHPFARWGYKYWDLKRFVEVSNHVAREHHLQPVWTSSPDEAEAQLLKESAAECSVKPILIPGSLSLNQMACLLQGARLYIGLDTAITHIAASTGVPVVALYGPTELWRWHPWNNDSPSAKLVRPGYRGPIRCGRIVTLQAGCDHPTCLRPDCYGAVENPCMMAITTDQVCQEASRLLSPSTTKIQQTQGAEHGR
ncbi:glycosyltransferase family 9 protein [Oryzomonas japonica]|nr:glycosyltransferase family 9 protein [Oryzomonas japonica]